MALPKKLHWLSTLGPAKTLGSFRRGFHGEADLTLADYNIDYNLGSAAKEVELELSIEGIRQ